jgi:hypothetical protein
MSGIKRRMPTKNAIKEHWASYLVDIGKFDSKEEVFEADYCFACGFLFTKDESNTERAHIVPRYISDDDSPSNIHLLCQKCHVDSEIIADRKVYMKWFNERNIMKTLMSYAHSLGLTE